MEKSGSLLKMTTDHQTPVAYKLPIGKATIAINKYIGKDIKLIYGGNIFCIKCGKKTNKSYSQGFCYPCFLKAPECDPCILRPELCQAQDGIARDLEWSQSHCLQPHFVYLSITSGLKVGVTRSSQIPTRWIDQGAFQAIKLAKTPNRYLAGLIEVDLKDHLADKTDWRKMLRNEYPELNLKQKKDEVSDLVSDEYKQYILKEKTVIHFEYPVITYPEKVKSMSFDKEPEISGTLQGIKGQYLLFDGNRVINIRKHQGYDIVLKA